MTHLPNTYTRAPYNPPRTAEMDLNTRQHVGMPVPEPAAPPFPKADHNASASDDSASRSPHNSVNIEIADATTDEEGSSGFDVNSEDEDDSSDNTHPCSGKDSKASQNPSKSNSARSKATFFAGASNVTFHGTPSFHVVNGNANITHFGGSNGPTNPFPGISFDAVNGDWRSGHNKKPFAPQTTSGTGRSYFSRSDPKEGSTGTAYDAGSSHSRRPRRENQQAGSSSTTSGSGSNDNNNPFAPFGGDAFGNGASGFTLSGGTIISVRGKPPRIVQGNLHPL